MFKQSLLLFAFAVGVSEPLNSQIAAAQTHVVEIQDFAFAPARIEAHPGDVIEWTNRDFAPHTATADGNEWTTEALKNGASDRFIATSPGEIAYHCKYHPNMKGLIVITIKDAHAAGQESGR
jgi:plastocyanin